MVREEKIKIVVGDNAFEIDRFESYEISSDLMTPADAFSFVAPNSDAYLTGKVNVGDICKISIDDISQMYGIIDEVSYETEDDGSRLNIIGRDIFQLLVDSDANIETLYKQDVLQVAKRLTEDWDFFTWSEILGLTRFNKIKIDPGEKIYDVINRLAKKDGQIIWCEADGTAVIGTPNYNQSPLYNLYLYKRSSQRSIYNNVLNQNVSDKGNDRYSNIVTLYTPNDSGNTDSVYVNQPKISAIDDEVQIYKQLIITDSDINNHEQASSRSEYEISRRKFEGLELNYTVKGHYGCKAGTQPLQYNLWAIDTLADIEDEISGNQGSYYLVSRKFRGGADGKFTDLTFRRKGLFLA